MNPVLVVVIIVGAAGLIYLLVKAAQAHAERERQRVAGLSRWAASNGFSFSPNDPWNLDGRYAGVGDIGKGHDRYAFEVLSRTDPVPASIFRYHYKTWETRTVTRNGRTYTETYEETHWRRYLIVELGVPFPQLFLRAEGMFDKLAGFIGFDDIDFESEEFSKRYFCKSENRQFAYAVIHPQMMEWMLAHPFEGELRQGLLIMDIGRVNHTPEGCQRAWESAAGFVNRVPPFVWQDYAKRAPIRLPEPAPYVTPVPAAAAGAQA